MPVYDYKCDKCNKVEEKFIKTVNPVEPICDCGEKMKRLISAPKVLAGLSTPGKSIA